MRPPRERIAARVLVLDPVDRVLLVHFRFASGSEVWGTPGGALEPGESHRDAARRELVEEVGVHDADLGPCVWTREHVFWFHDEAWHQKERIYLARVGNDALRTPGLSADELRAEAVHGHRWWTLDELRATDVELAPRRLAALLEELLHDGPPSEPFDVGV